MKRASSHSIESIPQGEKKERKKSENSVMLSYSCVSWSKCDAEKLRRIAILIIESIFDSYQSQYQISPLAAASL